MIEVTAATVRKFRHCERNPNRTYGETSRMTFGDDDKPSLIAGYGLRWFLSRMKPAKAARFYRRNFARCDTARAVHDKARALGMPELPSERRFR